MGGLAGGFVPLVALALAIALGGGVRLSGSSGLLVDLVRGESNGVSTFGDGSGHGRADLDLTVGDLDNGVASGSGRSRRRSSLLVALHGVRLSRSRSSRSSLLVALILLGLSVILLALDGGVSRSGNSLLLAVAHSLLTTLAHDMSRSGGRSVCRRLLGGMSAPRMTPSRGNGISSTSRAPSITPASMSCNRSSTKRRRRGCSIICTASKT